MFSNKTANGKALAMAFVSMLVICSFACLFTEGSDATDDQSYDIYMRVGDQFSYNPEVNLSGTTITASWTQGNGNGITATPSGNVTTVSGSASAAGNTTLLLTANWTGGTNSDLHQTATQTINFHIFDRLVLVSSNGSSDGFTASEVNPDMGAITTIELDDDLTLPSTTVTYSATVMKDGSVSDLFEYDTETHQVTATRQAEGTDEGTYTVTVKAEYQYSASGNSHATGSVTDSKEFPFTINIGEDLAIESGNRLETYVGNTDDTNTYTIKTNYDDNDKGITLQYTVATGNQSYVNWTQNSNTFSINTANAEAVIEDGEESGSFTVNVTVKADINKDGDSDDAGESETIPVTVIVFASLYYTSDPEIDGAVIDTATGNTYDVLATAQFEGATRITYNWGDGTSTTVNVTPDSGSKFSARHVYSEPRVYAVTITAENGNGNTKAILLYDATNGSWNAADEDAVPSDGDKSFFEEHGILFIVLAILAIILIALHFGIGFLAPYSLVVGLALVVAAVACFVTGDFGLTEELIENLNI